MRRTQAPIASRLLFAGQSLHDQSNLPPYVETDFVPAAKAAGQTL